MGIKLRALVLLLTVALLFASCRTAGGPAPEALPPEPSEPVSSEPEPPKPEPDPDPVEATPEPEPPPARLTEEEIEAIGEKLEPIIYTICQKYYVTGMSLAVFDYAGPLWEYSIGWASEEVDRLADEDTIYRIASISKAVTAMLAVDLAGQGKLDLDGDLSEIMGVTVRNPACPDEVITPWHLLTHTSGIVDSGAYGSGITSSPIWTLDRVVSRSFAPYAPGTVYVYSNFGMGMMSGVVESAAEKRFLDYTREDVFTPMGIDAAYSYDYITNKGRVANIYEGTALSVYMPSWQGMSYKYSTLPLGQLYGLGHGDLFITAKDLSRFARILAGAPQEGEPVSIPPELLEKMQTVQYREGEGESAILRGLGTQITDYLIPDHRMVGHQGNAYGSICGMFVDPEEHNGFVFLTNGAYMGKNDAGIYYVNEAIGRAVYGAFFDADVNDTGTELIVAAPDGETEAADAPEKGTELIVAESGGAETDPESSEVSTILVEKAE